MSTTQTPFIPQYYQDPAADLDYAVDWTTWLAAEPGDSIVTSTWVVPDGLESHDKTLSSAKAIIWLKGGTLGVNYDVANHVVTTQGRDEVQTIRLFIQTT